MKKIYKKAFKQLVKLHDERPTIDEVLRYIQTKQNTNKG